jgi:hypothetical protein
VPKDFDTRELMDEVKKLKGIVKDQEDRISDLESRLGALEGGQNGEDA